MQIRRTRQISKIKLFSYTAVFIVFAAVILFDSLKPATLPSIIYPIAAPLWRLEGALSDRLYGVVYFFDSKQRLSSENERLKAELDTLQNRLDSYQNLSDENAELKALLGANSKEKKVAAVVLSAPPISPYDTLIIDAGSKSGVEKGDTVIAGDGRAIGEISEVFSRYSRVELFSMPGKETYVRIGANHVEAVARGMGGGNFETTLPREITVSAGDSVFLASSPSTLFAKVSTVINRDTDYLELISFTSPLNFFELRYVAVIIDKNGQTQN